MRAIESERRTSLQYYRSVDHAVDVFCTYFGPTMHALQALDEEERQEFMGELEVVFRRYGLATASPS
ncbi:MAG: hypothetical protein ACOC9Z_03320 [Chloroflexota bacterium]